MKVPTYQSQTQITPKTGASSLSVQASPTNVSMGLAAQTDLFSSLQETSFKFLEMETKMTRNAELAAAENALDYQMANLTLAALNDTNPNTMIENWNTGSTKLFAQISNNISDPVVKRSFDTKAKDTIFSKRLSILKQARLQRIANAKGTWTERVYDLKRMAALGNPSEREQAKLELFGREEGLDFLGEKLPAIPSMYDKAFSSGLITKSEAIKGEMDAKGEIEGFGVYNDLSAAAVSGDPLQADAIIRNLDNPAKYPNIFGAERNALLKKAISLKESLQKDQIAKAKADQTSAEKELKTIQNNTERDFILRIEESKRPSSAMSNFDGPPAMPSIEELKTKFEKGHLRKDQYEGLVKKITTGGNDYSNGRVVIDHIESIEDAQDPAELESIREEIFADYRDDGILISDADYKMLNDRINTKLGNTKLDKRIKAERTNLKLLMTVNDDGGLMARFGDIEEDLGMQNAAIDALRTYDQLIADGTDPTEAYKYLADNWNAGVMGDNKSFRHLSLSPFVSNLLTGEFAPENLTPERVAKLKEKIRNSVQLHPNAKVYEMETLDYFLQYLNR
jgi:hypothetical protein